MATPMQIGSSSGHTGATQQGSVFNYVVTAHKPTAVIKSVVGSFTGPNDTNLIIAKSTRIEVHRLEPHGLEPVLELPIHGRVSCMELFRPKGKSQDNLFILVEKLKICVLEFDASSGEVITRAHGDVRDNIGHPSTNGQMVAIDPDSRAIAMHLYDGLIKVIPLGERGRLQDAFNARIEELQLVDICFLTGCERPTLAVLYEDQKHASHIKTYVLGLAEKEMQEGPWSQQNVDPGSGLVIAVPAPLGGVIVVGRSIVVYLSGAGSQAMRAAAIKQATMTAFGRLDADGSRYLLGDDLGNMYLLVLAHNGEAVMGLKMEIIGHTSAPSSISYLDAGVVFVGSRYGDSQLVRLHSSPLNPAEPNNYVELLETYTNLGPIIDFCVVDPEGQGQGQVVTCSGTKADGSLRIVRNGVGIHEQASVELHGIKGVWSLRPAWDDAHDKFLVLTFVGETRVLAINPEDELDEAEIPGFDAAAQTLYCGNTRYGSQLVQVTASGARLVDGAQGKLLSSWSPPAGYSINIAAGSPTQLLLATGGGHVTYLEVTETGTLVQRGTVQLDSEVACLDVSPLALTAAPTAAAPTAAKIAAVGTWSLQLRLLSLPDLATLTTEALGGEVIPRSVLLHTFDGAPYCLVGLGDGQLLNWRLDAATGAVSERKRVLLGTKPILLKTFVSNGTTNVFAGSDRPTIIYSSNKKIAFSNLNESEVNLIATFNSSSFADCLAIAKEGALTIGNVEEIQKLHVRTVPLHEQARRIVHQEATKTFGVLTLGQSGGEQCFLRVLDNQTFEVVASHAFQPQELVNSIASVTFGDPAAGSGPYYVVGTAFVRPGEFEPTKGRLVVLQYSPEERKVVVVTEREVKGSVYQVLPFQQKLVNSCNNKVQIHKLVTREDGTKELRTDCSHTGHVIALYLATRGDFILVGDLMRSVSVLVYKPEEETLEMRAQDFNTVWTTAVEMLDDDTFVVGENAYNLLVLRKVNDAATDEERARLEVVGQYHAGEFINRFQRGSLVMKLPDAEVATFPTMLYATTDGSISLMVSVPPTWYEFLSKLQEALRKVVKGVGGWDHASFRAFVNERKTSDARGVVDGDLVESFLDVGKEVQTQVVAHMGTDFSVESVVKRVEELVQGLH